MVLLLTEEGNLGGKIGKEKHKVSIGESPIGCETTIGRIPHTEIREDSWPCEPGVQGDAWGCGHLETVKVYR